MAFDVEGARKDGFSDQEILDYLRQSRKDAFDFDGAIKDGFSATDIVNHIGGIKPGSKDGVIATIAKDLGAGVADVASGYADSAEVAGKKDFAKFLKAGADLVRPDAKNYTAPEVKDPNKSWYDPTAYALSQVPRAIVRSAPGLASDVGAGAVGTLLGGPTVGLTAATGNYAARSAGSNIKERAANRTGNPNAEITNEDIGIGLATTGAEAALNTLGVKGLKLGEIAKGGFKDATLESLKTTGKAAAREGLTEAGQEAVNQFGLRTGTDVAYDPGRAIESAIVGGATGGAFRTPRTIQDVIQSNRFERAGISVDDDTRYVADLLTKEGTGRSGETAETLGKVETRLKAELNQALKDASLKKNGFTSEQKSFAQSLTNSVKEGYKLNSDDLETLREMGAKSKTLATAVKRYSVLDTISNMGSRGKNFYAGGVSNAIENLNPWRESRFTGLLASAIGGGSVIPGVAGLALPAQIAASFSTVAPAISAMAGVYGGARALDALTGYRNAADQFAKRFSSDEGQAPAPSTFAPDVEAMAREAQASQMANWLKAGGKPQADDIRDVNTPFRSAPTGKQVYEGRPGPFAEAPAPMPMARPVYNEPVGPKLQSLAEMQAWLEQQQQGARSEAKGVQGGMKALAKVLASLPKEEVPQVPQVKEVYKKPVGPEQPPPPNYFEAAQDGVKDAKTEAAKVQKAMKDLKKVLPQPEKPKKEPKAEKTAQTEKPKAEDKKAEPKSEETKAESKPKSAIARINAYRQMRLDDGYARMEDRQDIRDRSRYEKRMVDRIETDHSSIKDFAKDFSDKKLLNKLLDEIEPYSRVSSAADGAEYLDNINKKMTEAVERLTDADFEAISTLISRLDASKEKKK